MPRYIYQPKCENGKHSMDTTISQQPQAELIVPILDASLTNKIKHALELMNGVGKIRTYKPKTLEEKILESKSFKASMDDIKHGRVFHADSVEDMMKQILG